MPTPVNAARQCLAQEAAAVLDEAVAVARRRGHGQTTSLHMVSSLLSLPNSSLREACARARNSSVAYSARVQFKALDLSLSVSLDRLPSSSQNRGGEYEPPVSNSLMAAIKRSQANQRRQPENYSFYQQQLHQKQLQQSSSSSSPSSSVPIVKVELQMLIISILDDPLVSRVFGEAGFRNYDIKMAILRKGNSGFYAFGCTSRYKRPSPPMFMCNFPFMGGDDENFSTRIGEVMKREKKRCPLLLGASAVDALKSFLKKMSKGVVLADGPSRSGPRVVCVRDEIFRCLNGEFDDGPLRLRFEEVEKMVGDVKVVVCLGDFKEFAGDGVDSVDGFRFWVSKLGKLVEAHRGRLWLIGAAANYEVYFKVLKKFPSIEEDWDLEVLPVTSFKFSVGGSYPRSSLMESFVPLGGFFPIPPETKSPSSNPCQNTVRCHLCNEKYEQEVAALSNGQIHASVAQQCRSILPLWMQPAEPGPQSGSSIIKGKDVSLLLNAKITGLQRKWDDICWQHHLNPTFSKGYQFPHFPSSQVAEDRDVNESNNGSNKSSESSNERGNKNTSPSSSFNLLSSPDMLSKAKNLSILLESKDTGLGLGIISASVAKDPKSIYRALVERVCRQEEAISAITATIMNCRTRTNIWINIGGADRLGKKKLGLALADIVYGSTDSFIYVDLSFQNETTCAETLFNRQVTNRYDLKMRGTVVDYLVEKLSKKPSVVFLENIDKADQVVQNSLLQAVKNGRLTDLRGREIKISNCIFLGTTRCSRDCQATSSGEKSSKYTEDDILRAKGCSLEMMIRFDLNDDPTNENLLPNKRRFVGKSTRSDHCERAHKAPKSYLDLNLPAEGSETCDGDSESDSSSRSWLEDFDGQIDRTVVFKAFDFDLLGEELLQEINSCLRNVVGSRCSIEIEPQVMRQIVAAAYLFGNKRVEDWVRNVVRKAFLEAMGKFSLNARSIVRIAGCESTDWEELLPDRILVK